MTCPLRNFPHAPEPDPVETVRACLHADRLAIAASETYADIVARCCDAWNVFARDSATVRSTTRREYATTVKS